MHRTKEIMLKLINRVLDLYRLILIVRFQWDSIMLKVTKIVNESPFHRILVWTMCGITIYKWLVIDANWRSPYYLQNTLEIPYSSVKKIQDDLKNPKFFVIRRIVLYFVFHWWDKQNLVRTSWNQESVSVFSQSSMHECNHAVWHVSFFSWCFCSTYLNILVHRLLCNVTLFLKGRGYFMDDNATIHRSLIVRTWWT